MATSTSATSTSGTLSTGTGFLLTGLASGYDWTTLVDTLTTVARAPEQLLQTQQSKIQQQNLAYGSLVTELGVLKNKADALKDPTLYAGHVANVSDSTVATATATSDAPAGSYAFEISKLATPAMQLGATGLSAPLTADPSSLVLKNAAFSTPVTAGTFTVNGGTVTLAVTDTLQDVLNKIQTASGNAVTASYDSGADKIALSSSGPIILGSAGDTSNFLQVAHLSSSDTGAATSAAPIASVSQTAALASAHFATTVQDDGHGAGAFTINGFTIHFNASTDSLSAVIDRINNSSAGVTATYDTLNNRLTLTSNATGDMSIALQDVAGNFLAASKLSTGTLQRGTNLLYSVNGGAQISSQSNTITAASSGIAGLSVTALRGGTTTVTVGSDTASVKTALSDFITEYNKVQSLITTDTASSTDEKGTVTAGVLAGDRDITTLALQLRNSIYSPISGLSGSIDKLAALGYATNGNDNTIALSDSTTLDSVLANNLSDIQDLFTNATNGLVVTFSSDLDKLAGDNGTLVAHQNVLTKQSTDLDTQIAAQESLVQAQRQRLINTFTAMETAQAQINQQLTFLSQQTWGSSSTGK